MFLSVTATEIIERLTMTVLVNKDDVLCPDLYFRLKRQFGKVLVTNRGMGLVIRPAGLGSKPSIVSNGEYYRVNCPFCNDTRFRLYINHRWFEHKHMANCFNESCTSGELGKMRLDQLYLWLFNTTSQVSLPVYSGAVSYSDTDGPVQMQHPDKCVPVSSLPKEIGRAHV